MNLESLAPFINLLLLEATKVLGPVLIAAAFSYAYHLFRMTRSAVGADKWHELERWAMIAVKAAEQTGLASELEVAAEDKKAYAMDLLVRKAAQLGLKDINFDDLSALIEKTVFEQFNSTVQLDAHLDPFEFSTGAEPTYVYSQPFGTATIGYSNGPTLGETPNAKG